MSKMAYQDILIRDMACKYKMTITQMRQLVYSPFHLARHVITDDSNYHSIRVPYFGLFTQKIKTNKANRLARVKGKVVEHVQGNNLPPDLLVTIEELYEARDYEGLLQLAEEIGVDIKTYRYSK